MNFVLKRLIFFHALDASRGLKNKPIARGHFLSVAIGCLWAASGAWANEIQYNLTGFTGGGYSVAIHTTTTEAPQIGELNFTSANPIYGSTLLSYCTDVAAPLQGQFNYTPMSLAQATAVDQTWISGGGVNAATLWYNDKGAATTVIQTAGLQLAIWELLYNAPAQSYSAATFTSHNNGGYYVASTDANTILIEQYAASVLNNFASLPPLEGQVIWLAPTMSDGTIGGSQGLFAVGSISGVPEATSTLALLTLGLASLNFVSRKLCR